MLASFLSGEFLLHIPCWLHFCLGSFSYTSCAGFIFIWGVSLTHPALTFFFCGEFLLHIPCCLHFYAGSFSDTSCAAFIFMQGVSLTHPMLFFRFKFFFLSGESGFIFIWGVSHFLLHIPCWLLSGEFLSHILC